MNYFVSRTDQGLQVSFAVKQSNGKLRTGLVAGDFVATVVKSDDTSSSTFAVSENAQKAGLYSFTIAASFFNIAGVYKFVVEIDTFTGPSSAPNVRDALSGNVRATQEDVDTLADGGAGTFVRTTDSQEDIRDKLNTDLDVAVSSRASQTSVDAIQNVTRVAITIPTIVIPDAGTDEFEVTLNMFDTAGNPEDPDENVVKTPAGNAGDAITATDRLTVVNGAFVAADLNRVVRIVGATNGSNNKDVRISNVVDGTNVDVVDLDGTDPGLISEGSGYTITVIDQITVAVNDQAGVDVSSRLDSLVMAKLDTGRFKVTYTSTNTDIIENLIFHFTYVENAVTFVQDRSVTTVSALEDNFTAADRTVLNNIETDTIAIEADTQDIQNRLPAALVTGRMDSDVGAMQANVVTAAAIALDAIGASELATSAVNKIRDAMLSDSTPFNGADIAATKADTASILVDTTDLKESKIAATATAAAGSSTTEIRTTLTQATGFFDNMLVVVVNAAGVVSRRISEHQNTNGALFLDDPLPFTPAASDPVIVVADHRTLAGAIG